MHRHLIIVGIDPGTTLGYAIINIHGDILKISSSKSYNMSRLISEIVEVGKVLAVGCDKKKPPEFVQRFAVKTGGRLFRPDDDMPVLEKKQLTKNIKVKNLHEQDALASALFAYQKIQPMIKKVRKAVKDNNKHSLEEQVLEAVIKNEESISRVIERIEKSQAKGKEAGSVIKERPEIGAEPANFQRLKQKTSTLEKENLIVKKQRDALLKEIKKQRQRNKNILKRLKKKEAPSTGENAKQKTIAVLGDKIRLLEKDVVLLKEKLKDLNELFLHLENKVVVKKLANLGWQHFSEKNKKLNIKDNDVLLVNDSHIYSEKTLNSLKGKVSMIITKNRPISILKKYFLVIEAKNLKIIEEEDFAFVDKKDFEKELEKKDILEKLVTEYKDSRKT